jgi:5-methylthioadenosine/S-adenosylhomocysteine deaminase
MSVMKYFLPNKILFEGNLHSDKYIEVDEKGYITKIGQSLELTNDQQEKAVKLSGIVLPGLINSHSHAFQVLLRGPGDNPKNFHDWVDSALYPLIRSLKKEDIYTASKVAFAQMVRNGITSVAEFHYLHNLRPDENIDPYNNDPLSDLVIKAALDVGIRIRFLYTGYDLGTKPGQERFHRTVGEVVESLNKLKEKYNRDELVHIGTAPHSLHGASEEMIRSLKEWTIKNNEVMHIHLLEQKSDIQVSKQKYYMNAIEFLEDKDLLFDDLNIVHGIWVDDNDLNIISRYKINHIYNPVTNMYLGDGIAPILSYYLRGIPTALGTDANYNMDIWQEMKFTEWLQRSNTLKMGVLNDATEINNKRIADVLFEMGTINGGKALKLPIGEIKVGNYADFIVLKETDLSLRENGYLLDQLIFGAEIPHILKEVYIGGELTYSNENGFSNFKEKDLVNEFSNLQISKMK